jgi:hypothetical protein
MISKAGSTESLFLIVLTALGDATAPPVVRGDGWTGAGTPFSEREPLSIF